MSHEINSTDWFEKLAKLNVTESFNIVHDKIMRSIDKFAPEQEVRIKNKRNNKPWITRGIANSIRKSKSLFKKSLMDQNQEKKISSVLEIP